MTEYQKHANYSWKKEQLHCLLYIYIIGHFIKMCEKYVDLIIIRLHSTTEDVVEVKAVKVILASLNVLYIV